ncbi:8363_t:CDS:2 [Acaulospora morrowiae]|uniref:8363_t:CDS:1 n=1 Tax=Acaulospora morrowiae TaxID=94023 RepID=A0A9N8ZLT5_9GLOM|nr:8363_t:CDS:2 [Acaulospora morrowiae]
MPSGKDLGCGDSRKRGHNAEDCPKEDKFSQESFGTEGTQLDENRELGHLSKDSESSEETTDDYPSEILEDISIEENTEYLEEIMTGHPSKDLEKLLDNDETLMTENKRNNNVNEGEGNTGECLEEKTILIRADPVTKKSDQPSRIIACQGIPKFGGDDWKSNTINMTPAPSQSDIIWSIEVKIKHKWKNKMIDDLTSYQQPALADRLL